MFPTASFLSYIMITAITPGPNNILSMSAASRLGFKRSFPFNLGIFVGFVIVMALCTLFSSLLYAMLPRIQFPMKLLGASYMLHLAFKMLRPASFHAENVSSGFTAGMLMQFINPKEYIYGITSMATYVLPHFSHPAILAAFAVLLAFTGFICTVLWSLFGAVFRRVLQDRGRIIGVVMAILLLYCAVSLFL